MSMDEDELDAIRRKKLAELQQYQTQAVAEQQYREQVQAQRQLILRQILTPEARERLGRVQPAYPEPQGKNGNQLQPVPQSGRGESKRKSGFSSSPGGPRGPRPGRTGRRGRSRRSGNMCSSTSSRTGFSSTMSSTNPCGSAAASTRPTGSA